MKFLKDLDSIRLIGGSRERIPYLHMTHTRLRMPGRKDCHLLSTGMLGGRKRVLFRIQALMMMLWTRNGYFLRTGRVRKKKSALQTYQDLMKTQGRQN